MLYMLCIAVFIIFDDVHEATSCSELRLEFITRVMKRESSPARPLLVRLSENRGAHPDSVESGRKSRMAGRIRANPRKYAALRAPRASRREFN